MSGPSEWYDDTIYDRATDVPVNGGADDDRRRLARAWAGHIAGIVRDPEGNPIQGIDISACRFMGEEAEEQWLWGWGWACRPTRRASSPSTGLRPGTYQIELRDPNGVYAVEVYEDALNSGQGIDLEVDGRRDRVGRPGARARRTHLRPGGRPGR